MPRLIDDIRAAGRLQKPFFVPPHLEGAWAKTGKTLWPLLLNPDLTVLLVDNVADYYYQNDQEFWSLDKDFPNLAPPFTQFWAEHHIPSRIQSREKGETDVGALMQHGRLGVLITALDPSEVKGKDIPPTTRWILWCEIFIDYGRLVNHPGVSGPNGSIFLAIDEHGAMVAVPTMHALANAEHNDTMKHLMVWLHPVLLAISFLHCKNVTTVVEQMPAPLAKKFRAKYPGVQPTRYRTLVIEPLKAILRHQGRSHEVGLAKAMHICRGHFRDYRTGPGLFGKYHQLVWQPQTLRGGEKGDTPPPREIKVKV